LFYWLKLLNWNNKLIVNIYRMLCDGANDNTTYSGLNWAYHMKTLLQSIGLGNVWYEQRANNVIFFKYKTKYTWYI